MEQILLNRYKKLIHSISSQIPSRIFILKSRKHAIIPSFIVNSKHHISKLLDGGSKYAQLLYNQIAHFHTKILYIIFKDTCDNINSTQIQLSIIQEQIIINSFPHHFADDFLVKPKQYMDKQLLINSNTLINKFNRLYKERTYTFNFNIDPKSFLNLADIDVPLDSQWLFSMGSKCALPLNNKQFPLYDFIADAEEVIKNITDTK